MLTDWAPQPQLSQITGTPNNSSQTTPSSSIPEGVRERQGCSAAAAISPLPREQVSRAPHEEVSDDFAADEFAVLHVEYLWRREKV
ncbi:hypothetical protein JTE90_016970 [Oedothorax gibbosus]|uniref:Uncharacterized protein n=1 Tax=Oedothorax gibbosus TaxID=931172 RepID=A0AAV6UG76_9ARAC|nr:hypothetical protein JTE90_016970 [Oedothorax gibbosus]